MATVAELLAHKGQIEAQNLRDRADASARTYANLANIVNQGIQQYTQYKADAPKRELAQLQLDTAKDEQASQRAEAMRSSALMGLFQGDTPPSQGQIFSVVGPERGAKIVQALDALGDTQMKRYDSAQKVAAATLAGMDALPEQARAQAYGPIRQHLIDRGILQPDDVPAEYSPAVWQQIRGYGQAAPKAPEGFTLGPGQQRFSPQGEPIASVAPPEKPLTFSAPTPAMVNGKRVFIKTGSDGQTYDMSGNPMQGAAPTPIAPEGPKPTYEWAQAPTGEVKLMTPEEIRAQGGMKPTSAQEVMDARKFAKAAPIIDRLSDLSEKINTGQGIVAKAQGEKAKAEASMNLNDDVAEYQAVISGFTPMIARALGHTGVLTQQDVDSVKEMFPKPGDSKSLRDRKIGTLRTLMGNLEQLTGTKRSGAGGADPLGLRPKGGG